MRAPNDIEQAEYYYSQYKKERDAEYGSETLNGLVGLGSLAYQISKQIEEYNTRADDIEKTKRIWWWHWILTKRVCEKFKVKNIHRSKKAWEFYKKLVNKKLKVKGERLGDVHRDNVRGYIAEMAKKDKKGYEHYQYVLSKLNGKFNTWEILL